MAGRIDRSQRERLVAAGQWAAFQRRRDELKAQGSSPNDARAEAFREVMLEGRDERRDGGDAVATENHPPSAAEDHSLPIAPVPLAGKTADEPTIVRWVARNVDVAEPDPSTCPDPFAWTLLRECRETPGFMATFLEKCWVRLIPPKSQLESSGPTVQDGKSIIELTDRILAMLDEAATEAASSGSS